MFTLLNDLVAVETSVGNVVKRGKSQPRIVVWVPVYVSLSVKY